MRTSLSPAVIKTQRNIGLGVRLGTTDVKRVRASESAALLKFIFIIHLQKDIVV